MDHFNMNEMHSQFIHEFSEKAAKEGLDDHSFDAAMNAALEIIAVESAEGIFKQLIATMPEMLSTHRELEDGFKTRNLERWDEGFNFLRALIVCCDEIGEASRNDLIKESAWQNSAKLNVLTTSHARGLRVAREVVCLIENGFPDGALARWRTLHELATVSSFIAQNKEIVAERYLASRTCKSFKAAKEYVRFESSAGLEPFGDTELRHLKTLNKHVVETYGEEISNDWGWAHGPLKAVRPTFSQLEEYCGLDHWRPRVRWSNQEIHGGFIPNDKGLGVSEAIEQIQLVGQSNSGMTDPGHMTAISLNLLTTNLLLIEPNLDRLIFQKCLQMYCDEVGSKFLIGNAKRFTETGDY